jgi:ribosomal protein S18 acetylase RimI-like enzyme
MLDRDEVIYVQEIASNAWPAEDNFFLNGWILRFTHGTTGRANSVLPLRYWGQDLDYDIKIVENAYNTWGLPPKFMLHDYYEPINLYEELARRNYQKNLPVNIMGLSLQNFPKVKTNTQFQYTSNPQMSDAWFKALQRLATNRSARDIFNIKGIMEHITIPQTRYFEATIKGEIIGIVLAILERGYLGIMDLIVDPVYRRQGVASSLIARAVQWAFENKANYMYLQVFSGNSMAINLYTKMNFQKWYNYFYMVKQSPQA